MTFHKVINEAIIEVNNATIIEAYNNVCTKA